jgi:phospholipid/cholesterol/gamma-HCH transport system substrate-binding protein
VEGKEERQITPQGSLTERAVETVAPAGTPTPRAGGPRVSLRPRQLVAAALILAVVVVAVIVLEGGGGYTLKADFQDASGLVTGDLVLIGPAQAGTIESIGLTPGGAAQVTMSLKSGVGPLHQGTVARIFEDSLSGIADKYVALEPGSSAAPVIPDGGVIGESDTYSEVNLDQIFDTFDPLTRAGLSGFIRGEAASLRNGGEKANRALEYLAPALQSTSEVTSELAHDQPVFDALVVKGAQALQALASRSQQLTQLIANTGQATGAIASQSQALQQALALFPATLSRSATTFAGLDTTLDALDPLVSASTPAVRRLPEFLSRLAPVLGESEPTLAQLNALIADPSGGGDLTTLARESPSVERVAAATFPRLIAQFNASQQQTDELREYTPDVVAALSNLGQVNAYYDANGHYARSQPDTFAFTTDGSGDLTMQFPSDRYAGLQRATARCPGGAVQPDPDGSTPERVRGCSATSDPQGP